MGSNIHKIWRTKARMQARDHCRAKVSYPSFDDALAAAQRIGRRLGLKFHQTAYVCPVCGGYHLTTNR